jgi:hypothetical protein
MTSAAHCTQRITGESPEARDENYQEEPSGTSPGCATMSSEACDIINSLFLYPMEVTKASQIL